MAFDVVTVWASKVAVVFVSHKIYEEIPIGSKPAAEAFELHWVILGVSTLHK